MTEGFPTGVFRVKKKKREQNLGTSNMIVTFEEKEVCYTDWKGWEIYVCSQQIEYWVSKPIIWMAQKLRKMLFWKEIAENLKFYSEVKRITSERLPFNWRTQILLVTLARTVHIKSLGPNDSDLTGEWELKWVQVQIMLKEIYYEKEKKMVARGSSCFDRFERFLFKFDFSYFFSCCS